MCVSQWSFCTAVLPKASPGLGRLQGGTYVTADEMITCISRICHGILRYCNSGCWLLFAKVREEMGDRWAVGEGDAPQYSN